MSGSGAMIKVRIEELMNKCKSKDDLYNVLTKCCKFYLPDMNICNIRFLKDVLCKKKLAFKTDKIKTIVVPQYEELAPKNIYHIIKANVKNFDRYFADYDENEDYLPPRRFMWDVFATLNYELANDFVDHSMKARFVEGEEEKNRSIEIDPEIYDMMMKSNYFTKKKGRVLSIMAAGNINKKISRKRKAKVELFQPDKSFKHSSKRAKRNELNEDDEQFIDMRSLKKKDEFADESDEHVDMELERQNEEVIDSVSPFVKTKKDTKDKLKSILNDI